MNSLEKKLAILQTAKATGAGYATPKKGDVPFSLNNYSRQYVESVQANLNEIWKPEIEAGKRKPFTYEEALKQVQYENRYYQFKAIDAMMKQNGTRRRY